MDGSTFAALIEEAEKYVGMPYRWGGSTPATSFDCSGFVCYTLNESGAASVGRTTAQGLFNLSTPVALDEAEPGDLLFFHSTYSSVNPVTHVAIYLGGGNFGKNHEILKRELADLFDEDKVRLLGYVADEDVNTLYSNSLFFTYVSLYEGFGMPPLEAMSAGVPVVTSNTSALPEVVGDAAITLDPTDKDAIIKAYEAFYFNPELREECIQKGLERAKMFSWDKMYKIISDKILEVLNDKTKNSNDLGDNRSRRRLLSETSA